MSFETITLLDTHLQIDVSVGLITSQHVWIAGIEYTCSIGPICIRSVHVPGMATGYVDPGGVLQYLSREKGCMMG